MNHNADSICLCRLCRRNKNRSNRRQPSKAEESDEDKPLLPTMKERVKKDYDQATYFTCLLELLRKEGNLVRAWQEPLNMVDLLIYGIKDIC